MTKYGVSFQNLLNLASLPDEHSTFLACGGNSFKAIKLMQWIEDCLSVNHNSILEYILMETFSETCQFLWDNMLINSPTPATGQLLSDKEVPHNPSLKRKQETNLSPNKRKQNPQSISTVQPSDITTCLQCGIVQVSNIENGTYIPELITISRGPRYSVLAPHGTNSKDMGVSAPGSKNCSEKLLTQGVKQVCSTSNKEVSLSLLWKYNTGKCVDASPLLVMHR